MSNFYLISEGGDGLGLAIRLKEEGHNVAITIKDSRLEDRGENLVEKDTLPGFGSIILADCTGSGPIFDAFREAGGYTYGGSQIADRLESDRSFASQTFSEAGIEEPNSESFKSWEEGEAFIADMSEDIRLVFKPEGKWSGNLPSYVSKDSEDLLGYMKTARSIIGEAEPEFVLQEFIEGICISSEAWYAKDHFILPTNHTLERKQFLCGDLGPSGGCTGNIVWRCDESNCPLCRSLEKLSGFLEKHQYNGCIDINSVVSKEGEIYALEFTPRFGYDAFPTLLYGLFDGDFGDFIESCAKGRGPNEMPLRPGFAAGVRISNPPWPSEDFKSKANIPIRGLRGDSFESFYPYEVSKREDGLVTSGGVGIIGVAIGYSESSIEEAFEDAYKVCKKIQLQDSQYRTDLSDVLKSDLRKLTRSFNSVKTANT
jgi:phosphoribosylamine-glycine ligase